MSKFALVYELRTDKTAPYYPHSLTLVMANPNPENVQAEEEELNALNWPLDRAASKILGAGNQRSFWLFEKIEESGLKHTLSQEERDHLVNSLIWDIEERTIYVASIARAMQLKSAISLDTLEDDWWNGYLKPQSASDSSIS